MKIFKTVALFALAIVAVPIGFVYGIVVAIVHVITYPRTAGRELYEAFRQLSKIVSVMAAEMLNAVLIHKSGIAFGTHTVSANGYALRSTVSKQGTARRQQNAQVFNESEID